MPISRQRRHVRLLPPLLALLVTGCGDAADSDDATATVETPSGTTASGDDDDWIAWAEPDLDGEEAPLGVHAVVEWDGQLLVIAADGDGEGSSAWVSEDGTTWQRRPFEPPQSCGEHGGVVTSGDRLLVSCQGHGDAVREDAVADVGVAITTDLEDWDVERVGTAGVGFGTAIGPGPDGGVSVLLLEAADRNTTEGARLRVWTTEGSNDERWVEVTGIDPGTLVDAAPQRIRAVGDRIVITGAVAEYAPDGLASYRPAVWVADPGGPLTRIELPVDGVFASGGAWAFDAVSTPDGVAVVGGANDGNAPLAWVSADFGTWRPARIDGQNGMWSVASDEDGTLVAAASSSGDDTSSWISSDSGATWRQLEGGPELLGHSPEHGFIGASTTPNWRMLRLGESAPR